MEEALSAFVQVNGFCSRNCQDYALSSMLICADMGIPHYMPLTTNPEIFTIPPFDLEVFFNLQLLPLEIFRSWIFTHGNIPPQFSTMPSGFKWNPEYYQVSHVNNKLINIRVFKLRYNPDSHIHANAICQCDHQQNIQLCHGWLLFQYTLGANTLFCLSLKLGNQNQRVPLKRCDSDVRVFEGREEHTDCTPKKRKLVLGGEGQCMPALGGSGEGVTANPDVVNQSECSDVFRLDDDHHDRKRKKEARKAHKHSTMAQKSLGIKGKMIAKKNYAEKALMKKTLKMHESSSSRRKADENVQEGAVPAYLLDREETTRAKQNNGRGWLQKLHLLDLLSQGSLQSTSVSSVHLDCVSPRPMSLTLN